VCGPLGSTADPPSATPAARHFCPYPYSTSADSARAARWSSGGKRPPPRIRQADRQAGNLSNRGSRVRSVPGQPADCPIRVGAIAWTVLPPGDPAPILGPGKLAGVRLGSHAATWQLVRGGIGRPSCALATRLRPDQPPIPSPGTLAERRSAADPGGRKPALAVRGSRPRDVSFPGPRTRSRPVGSPCSHRLPAI
jgi:hypothetical protein